MDKRKKETYIAGLALAGILAHLWLRYGFRAPAPIPAYPLLVVVIVGGAPLLFDLVKKSLAKEFGSDLLAGLSIVTSLVLGEYLAGSIVVLMLAGGTALEQYATQRASAVLGALAKRMPSVAHRAMGTQLTDIRLEEVGVGDRLVVFRMRFVRWTGWWTAAAVWTNLI